MGVSRRPRDSGELQSFKEWKGRRSFALAAQDRDNSPDLEGERFAEMENSSLS